jgi:LDH2 family malate/lactate/ureidoglycolate dehydrogenase
MAINPGNFEDGFEDRLQDLIDYCRQMEPVEEDKPVLVAGDPERLHINKCEKHGGIPYHPNQVKYAFDIATDLNIPPPAITGTVKF